MYAKYQTEAIVLNSSPLGEADKLFLLMTREFGLVRARASAVRAHYSRMRYALQLYAECEVSLVRGSRGWRVAGAASHGSTITRSREQAAAFARVARLVERLVTGEEKHEELFVLLRGTRAQLSQNKAAWATIEIVAVARMLHMLGYLSHEALHAAGVDEVETHRPISIEDIRRNSLISAINEALSVTHL